MRVWASSCFTGLGDFPEPKNKDLKNAVQTEKSRHLEHEMMRGTNYEWWMLLSAPHTLRIYIYEYIYIYIPGPPKQPGKVPFSKKGTVLFWKKNKKSCTSTGILAGPGFSVVLYFFGFWDATAGRTICWLVHGWIQTNLVCAKLDILVGL